MVGISNQNNCEGGRPNDIMASYHIEFTVNTQGRYHFHTPLDFGFGGFILFDG